MPRLKGAFIGFGNIAARGHWLTYRDTDEAEIVAIMDPSKTRQKFALELDNRLPRP